MYLVWLATILALAKWLDVSLLADVSWWWILGLYGAAFVWFEGLERVFGRDKRQVDAADYEKRAAERINGQFANAKNGRARR